MDRYVQIDKRLNGWTRRLTDWGTDGRRRLISIAQLADMWNIHCLRNAAGEPAFLKVSNQVFYLTQIGICMTEAWGESLVSLAQLFVARFLGLFWQQSTKVASRGLRIRPPEFAATAPSWVIMCRPVLHNWFWWLHVFFLPTSLCAFLLLRNLRSIRVQIKMSEHGSPEARSQCLYHKSHCCLSPLKENLEDPHSPWRELKGNEDLFLSST